MRAIWMLALLLVAQPLRAEGPPPRTEPLWPDRAPLSSGDGEGDVPQLMLTFPPSESPTAAVLILPGGGYHGHAIDHEGDQIAAWLKSLGVTSAICTYRVRGKGNAGKGYGHPAPMTDAIRALQTLRGRAEEWNIDPSRVGVMGFSAGGHLCATVSNLVVQGDKSSDDAIARVHSRPDFAILCYPVIAFDKPFTHKGSQRNLLGDDFDSASARKLSAERQVSAGTPPTFIFHTGRDQVVPVENAIEYYLACKKHNVPAEMHLFHEGRHGLGLAGQQPGASQWPALCENWLRRLGVVTK